MNVALITAPVVASYSLIVSVLASATKRLLPDTASPWGLLSPVMKLALIAAPVVASYALTIPGKMEPSRPEPLHVTNSVLPDTAIVRGLVSPVMKFALITAPVEASYSLTIPVPAEGPPCATKRVLPDTASPPLAPVTKVALIGAPVVAL